MAFPRTAPSVIDARALRRTFGDVVAVDRIDLTTGRGEEVAVASADDVRSFGAAVSGSTPQHVAVVLAWGAPCTALTVRGYRRALERA